MTDSKVLFVVDKENSGWLNVEKLKDKGFTTVSVVNGAFDAVSKLVNEGADLLVVQTALPDITGYQLCSLIKSNDRTTSMPVVLVKADEDKPDAFWNKAALADEIITLTELVGGFTTIHELLDRNLKKGNERDWSREKAKAILSAELSLTTSDIRPSYGKLLDILLIERLIARVVRALSGVVDVRRQFIDSYFEVVDELFTSDVLGFAVANQTNPWMAFRVKKGLSKSAYDELLAQLIERLQLPAEPLVDLKGELKEESGNKIEQLEVLPVAGEKSGIGALIFASYTKKDLSVAARAFISELQLGMQPLFKLLLAKQEIEVLQGREAYRANVDSLTGLYNLEFLVGFIQQQLLFSFRQRLPVGLAIIDIDHLGSINEEFGYNIGDVVLSTIANRLLAITRSSDLIARYGGDEFAVVLPNTDVSGAKTLGEKVRSDIEQLTFLGGKKGPKVTVSVGCANFNMEDLNPETILRDAKLALQKAKEGGENKVAVEAGPTSED